MLKLVNLNPVYSSTKSSSSGSLWELLPTKALFILSLGVIEILIWTTPGLTQSATQNDSRNQAARTQQQKTQTVKLNLADVVQLINQNSRSLKNNLLTRIINQQELIEANSKFTPTITPRFSVSTNRSLSSSSSLNTAGSDATDINNSERDSTFDSSSDGDASNDNFNRSLQIDTELLTPLGTNITLTADPLADFRIFGLEIRQPLLRGAGTRVNQASVQSARLNNTRQMMELKQSLNDQIFEGIKAYRTLVQAQEEVRIRQNSLKSRRHDLQVQEVLVNFGRRARADLVQLESSVASAEEQLLSARNSLSQANADLLKIIDIDKNLNIVVSQESIKALTDEKLLRPVEISQEDLLQQAYRQRPDYLQANLNTKIAQLALIESDNNRKWQLDAVSNFNLGDTSEAIAGLELTRTFKDQSLQTAFERSRIELLQRENDVKEIQETVKVEVSQQIKNVNSNLARIEKARHAKTFAEERLEIVKQLYRRGRGGVDIFQITSQQDEVVEAQNAELNAIIDYLNARTDLEQSLGDLGSNNQKIEATKQ